MTDIAFTDEKTPQRLDRIELMLEQILLEQIIDRAVLRYLDGKADATAVQHWDLVDALITADVEPGPEPASSPLAVVLPAAS